MSPTRLSAALTRSPWNFPFDVVSKSLLEVISEHSLELEQFVSRVACAMHNIGAMLAPEAVERVCWHTVAKLHLLVGGSLQNLLTAENGGSLVGTRTRKLPAHQETTPVPEGISPPFRIRWKSR